MRQPLNDAGLARKCLRQMPWRDRPGYLRIGETGDLAETIPE
jgi:hypothetical protein